MTEAAGELASAVKWRKAMNTHAQTSVSFIVQGSSP